MTSNSLETEIKYLKGVGEKRAKLFEEINIKTVFDLLHYFPYKHYDRSKIYQIADIPQTDAMIQFRGRIQQFNTVATKRQNILVATVSDGSGTVEVVWFAGHSYIQRSLKTNIEYLFFGKPNVFNQRINFIHPEIEPLEKYYSQQSYTFSPVYSLPEKFRKNGLTSKNIQDLMLQALAIGEKYINDFLPEEFLHKHRLIPLAEAIRQIHFPNNHNRLKQAEYRLKFDEFFVVHLNLLYWSQLRKSKRNGFLMPRVGKFFNHFFHKQLPFELTDAQKRVVREIFDDLKSGYQMNRLLQGDVGSGKTLVILLICLLAGDNGFQSCIMAPTEILAIQHYRNITKLLGQSEFKVALLTGSTKKKERTELHKNLEEGKIHLLIGTHALIEETVRFHKLGFVAIDEQHRFGVAQRAKLWEKGEQYPHVLVVTATPIPRTLAMTVYGDLDISIIDQLPPGRKPIKTVHYYENQREKLFDFIREQISEGRQIYVVFPLIEESEKLDYQNLMEGYQRMVSTFGEKNVIMLHGKMKSDEKEEAMQRFIRREAMIMVATTVIEVGVDVPNATVMIIESSHRFGLSQMHQLRGRVGRGGNQSYCILLTPHQLTRDSRKRIEVMTSTNDGFIIAEEDLKLRGFGDLEGTRQSGLPFELKIASLVTDQKISEIARNAASELLEKDPNLTAPQHQKLKQILQDIKKGTISWGMIS
ncbi:MAG TPA: ATP-dependent DNA helicase RecG [Salinivirgaceae bacterium]|nr:ATP-dependent DNA helicase RecG [Salinivirgaceae bacterium]